MNNWTNPGYKTLLRFLQYRIVFALITSITAVVVYKHQGTQKRTEFFSKKIQRYLEKDFFNQAWSYLDTIEIKKFEAI